MLEKILVLMHVIISVTLIALVLLQQGKGAELGATFGSAASQTVFGSQGFGSFLLKLTGIVALLFFVTSLTLGYVTSSHTKQARMKDGQSNLVQSYRSLRFGLSNKN